MKGISLMNINAHFLNDYSEDGINLSSIIEPLYLCRWNGVHSINGRSQHEIVEIHSKDSLIIKYLSTNLFDERDLTNWIESISNSDDFYHQVFINDNFEIERIK